MELPVPPPVTPADDSGTGSRDVPPEPRYRTQEIEYRARYGSVEVVGRKTQFFGPGAALVVEGFEQEQEKAAQAELQFAVEKAVQSHVRAEQQLIAAGDLRSLNGYFDKPAMGIPVQQPVDDATQPEWQCAYCGGSDESCCCGDEDRDDE